ncbi:nucleoside hydrolase-like domain-containing protein [Haloferula helveola]|uniref:nucleoside hydrolase-like domain-containing protein n=1 Tax=Haloferula helveola TaxID=490095 RepID=UPI0030CBBF20
MKPERTSPLGHCALVLLLSLTPFGAHAQNQVTGTPIGHTGSYGNNPATEIGAALDGDLATFVDAASGSGGYVGYDVGAGNEVNLGLVCYAPRTGSGFPARMVGGEIRGSNDPTLASYTTLATIATAPAEGVRTLLPISSDLSFRYVYYASPVDGYCNIAELEFYEDIKLSSATPIGHAGSFNNDPATTITAALDSNLLTFVDAPTASGGYVGYDFGAGNEKSLGWVTFAPRPGFAGRMVGGEIRGSNSATLTPYTTLGTIATAPADGITTGLPIPSTASFRYVWYSAPADSYCNLAEITFYGDIPTLSDLTIDTGSLTFEEGRFNYKVFIAGAASSVNLTATPANGGHTVTNGGNINIPLTGGRGMGKIEVSDGTTTTLYTVEVIAATHHYPFEGNANDLAGGAHGTLQGGASISNGALVTAAQGQYLSFDPDAFDFDSYDAITLEAFVTTSYGQNSGKWTYLMHFGNEGGARGYFVGLTRTDNNSVCEYSGPGYHETGIIDTVILRPEIDDGQFHHVVSVLTEKGLSFYLDGELYGYLPRNGPFPINTGTATKLATLARGAWLADPTWIGEIHEFNVYRGSMDAATVEARSTSLVIEEPTPDLEDGTYTIINRNSGKALDIFGAVASDGANVVQWAPNGGDNQKWVVEHLTGDTYSIRSALDYAFSLDVFGWSTVDGGDIKTWTHGGGANQQWVIQSRGDIYNTFTVGSVHSGKVLDVVNLSFADGANVQQWTNTGSLNQEWYFEPVTPSVPTNLVVTTEDGLVTLTWDEQPGSTRFNIMRDSGSGYVTIATGVLGNTFYDSTAAGGTNYDYKVTAVSSMTESGASTAANVTPLTPEQQWRMDEFGTIDETGPYADDADFDLDGASNELERYFYMNPLVSDTDLLPLFDLSGPNLSLTYRKAKSVPDLNLTVEEGDLVGPWSPAAGTTEILSEDDMVQELRFTAPVGADPKKFFRVRAEEADRPRVIVTTDGEEDDQASMVRFLLTSNEFDVEAIVSSSSQFHWVGGTGWNAFHRTEWFKEYIALYGQVYDNLVLHDPNYPSPEFLLSRSKVGNISAVGEYNTRTEGAEFIVDILLDDTDPRPVWVQAWGGCNTLAAALKIIQDDHPARMAEVAAKLRLFLIWEQDQSYKDYIYPNWESLNIPTIISDQFDCIAYEWGNDLPDSLKASHFNSPWASTNIVTGHGALCAAYVNSGGAFNAEGDSPAFLHTIPNGLRSMESPGFGGWGGRYVNVPGRNNVWMDPRPAAGGTWNYPNPAAGEWRSIHNSWAKTLLGYAKPDREQYFKPIWRWMDDAQNDLAARADWCVMDYASANHHPVVRLKTPLDIDAVPGQVVTLDATPTSDPDGDALSFMWWNYFEADSYPGAALPSTPSSTATIAVPAGAVPGNTIHMICEVTDGGSPSLTRYQRVVVHVVAP